MKRIRLYKILLWGTLFFLSICVSISILQFRQKYKSFFAENLSKAHENIDRWLNNYAVFWENISPELSICSADDKLAKEINQRITELKKTKETRSADGKQMTNTALQNYYLDILRQEIDFLYRIREYIADSNCDPAKRKISERAVELTNIRIYGFLSLYVLSGHRDDKPFANAVVVKNADGILAFSDTKLGSVIRYNLYEMFPAQNALNEFSEHYSAIKWKPLGHDLFNPTEKGCLQTGWKIGKGQRRLWTQSWIDDSGNVLNVNISFWDNTKALANVTIFYFPKEFAASLKIYPDE
jgi:hypothetical protein